MTLQGEFMTLQASAGSGFRRDGWGPYGTLLRSGSDAPQREKVPGALGFVGVRWGQKRLLMMPSGFEWFHRL